jgi:hypothetical protein
MAPPSFLPQQPPASLVVSNLQRRILRAALLAAAVVVLYEAPPSFATLVRAAEPAGALRPPRSAALEPFPLSCEDAQVRADMAAIAAKSPGGPGAAYDGGSWRNAAAVMIWGSLEANFGALANFRDIRNNFPALDEHLLAPHGMVLVVLYDFPATPAELVAEQLSALFNELSWKRLPDPLRGGHPTDGEWRSLRGTRVIVKGRRFELPLYIKREPQLVDRQDWLGCAGSRPSLSYNLYAGPVWSHHLFFEPLLDQFDFVFKVDTDIRFVRRAPEAPSAVMQKQGCLFMHSKIVSILNEQYGSDCNNGVLDTTTAFARLLGNAPASAAYRWCRDVDYFYGNFIGFNLRFYTSPTQLYFSRWMYECVRDGYFRYRWADQALFPMYLCLARDIPDLANSSDVCSLQSWRDSVFIHE